MTKVLRLSILGQVELAINDDQVTTLASGKAQALLFYLMVNGRSTSRQALAGLLWGDLPEADARRNLRGVLMKLRQEIAPYLIISHQAIGINPDAAIDLDVTLFQQLIEQGGVDNFKQATTLYRGEFLEDFYVRDAPDFEAWVSQRRSQYHQLVMTAYDALIAHHLEAQQYGVGIELAQRLLNLDMMRETSHRHLMRLYAFSGEQNRALNQYDSCRSLLANELEVEVSEETAVLAIRIRSGTLSPTPPRSSAPAPAAPSPPPPFIAGPPITYPARFYGRELILKRLFNLFRQRPLQNAAIIGPRRSGKTSLLHYLKNITTAPPNQCRADQRIDWLPNPTHYRWIFVDFQDPRLGTSAGLLDYLLVQMGFEAQATTDIDHFLDVVAFNLHQPTIILFDEIGVALERYPELDDTFWESLRSLATNQVDGNLGFVLTSHAPPEQLAQHSGLGSPFFNIFGYTAQLGPLKEAEAQQFISSTPIPFPEADAAWILEESDRWPFLMQILCRERLLSLEEKETHWQEEALRQMAPFRKLKGEA